MPITADRATLYRFFALPAAAAHESWLAFMPPEVVSISRRSRLGTLILSRMLTRHALLPEPRSFDLATHYQWVLADNEKLMDAALRLGAMTLGARMATTIVRDRVRLYRSALGNDLFREAVSAAAEGLADIPAAALDTRSTVDELQDFTVRAGVALMLAVLPNDAMRSRLAVKLPHDLAAKPGVELTSYNKPAVLEKLRTMLSPHLLTSAPSKLPDMAPESADTGLSAPPAVGT